MASYLEDTSFLFGANEAYVTELYAQYLNDPGSVAADWSDFFDGLDDNGKELLRDLKAQAGHRVTPGSLAVATAGAGLIPPLD